MSVTIQERIRKMREFRDWDRRRYLDLQEQQKQAKEQKKCELFELIEKRTEQKKDTRILICGEGGIGKSYLALKVGEAMNPETFIDKFQKAVDDQVHFEAAEYMKAVTYLPTKSVLVYDEPGQTFFSREFMSEANMILSKTMVGYRYKKFINIFCVPYVSIIDATARKLCQFKIDVLEHGFGEVYKIMPGRFQSDIFYSNLMGLRISMPGVKLRHAYDKKKERLQDDLYNRYATQLTEKQQQETTNDEMVQAILKEPEVYMKNEKLHNPTIKAEFKIGRGRAETIRASVEKHLRTREQEQDS